MSCLSAPGHAEGLWDVLVVGAGVAGSMAASGAAQRGLSVLLIDKAAFPRGKVCGCCLNPAAVKLLEEAECDIRASGATPIERLYLACGGTTAKIPIPVVERRKSLTINRCPAPPANFFKNATACEVSR